MTDEIPADHRALIVAQAERRGMTEWSSPSGTLVAVGDAETFYELVRDGDRIAFVVTQRSHAVPQIVFGSVADAVRYLVFVLSDRIAVPPPAFAPGSSYTAVGDDRVLRWPGGEAVSPGGRVDPETAREFTWVATADPADIAARRVPVLRVADGPA